MSPLMPMEGPPIWPLFQTILSSIVQVMLLSVSGYVLARRGILDKSTQKLLNSINVNFFLPCFLFSKVAFFLSPEKLKELWIIPIFFLLLIGTSSRIAWLLGNLFRLKPSQRNFVIAAATCMNANSLPVALLQTLATTVPELKWGEDDTKDAIMSRALTYLLICGTMGQINCWSYGVHLLSRIDPLEETEHSPELHHETGSTGEGITDAEQSQRSLGISSDNHEPTSPSLAFGKRGPVRRDSAHIYSFPSSSQVSNVQLPLDSNAAFVSESAAESDDDEEPPAIPAWSRRPLTLWQRVGRSVCSIWRKVTSSITPPLWAALISLIVALCQPLQHLLVHMHPFQGAVTQAGNCSIPITLVVLGAYFHQPSEKPETPTSSSTASWQRAWSASGLREIFYPKSREEQERQPSIPHHNRRGEGRAIFVAILTRMVVVPALFLPLIAISARRTYPPVFQDPVFILCTVLLLGSPPALALAQITLIGSIDIFQRLVSRAIFWSYCLVAPPAMVGYALVAMIITKL